MRTNLSYEFASKFMDATDGVGAVGGSAKPSQMNQREQQIMKRVMGLSKP